METRRTHRVADLIRDEVADILQREVRDPRIGFITLTGVDVSADLGLAKVYYTVLGDTERREETERGLRSARPFIRREVAHRLRLKSVPEIRFLYDESIDRGLRVQELLEDIRDEGEDSNG